MAKWQTTMPNLQYARIVLIPNDSKAFCLGHAGELTVTFERYEVLVRPKKFDVEIENWSSARRRGSL
jgi:hypothetical protein